MGQVWVRRLLWYPKQYTCILW